MYKYCILYESVGCFNDYDLKLIGLEFNGSSIQLRLVFGPMEKQTEREREREGI